MPPRPRPRDSLGGNRHGQGPRGDVASITQHWFRHKLATDILSLTGDLRAAMAQSGWRDVDSMIGYVHDVPKRRRREQSTDRRHSFDTCCATLTRPSVIVEKSS